MVAVDGYGHQIIGFITILKNTILLFQPLQQTEGMWNQVRVDHGTEFALISTALQCFHCTQF